MSRRYGENPPPINWRAIWLCVLTVVVVALACL